MPLLGVILGFPSCMKPACIQFPERFEKYIAEFHSNGEDEPWLSLKELGKRLGVAVMKLSVMKDKKSLKVCGDGKHYGLGRSHQNLFQ